MAIQGEVVGAEGGLVLGYRCVLSSLRQLHIQTVLYVLFDTLASLCDPYAFEATVLTTLRWTPRGSFAATIAYRRTTLKV